MATPRLRIGFMGTPEFAATTLQALIGTDHDIICVYTQPPRPKGRGHKVQKSHVHTLADTYTLPVHHPQNFKTPEPIETFKAHNLDIAIVAAYGLILPQEILDAPKHGCINIHASLLPRWRGASPIQHAIWKGDEQTGITLMQMDKGLDTGDILMKQTTPLTETTSCAALHDTLADIGADMTTQFVSTLANGDPITRAPQDNGHSTYAPLLKKTDGHIDWKHTAQEISCQIRALNPWPGVWTAHNGKRLKILEASITNNHKNQPAGLTIDKTGIIACGKDTALKLQTLQPEGKKAMSTEDAFNGGYINIGDILT